MLPQRFAVIFSLIFFSGGLFADVIITQRGDILACKIVSEDAKMVTVDYAQYRTEAKHIQFAQRMNFDTFYTMKIKDGPIFSNYTSENLGDFRLMTGNPILGKSYILERKNIATIKKTRIVMIKMRGSAAANPQEMIALSDNSITIQDLHADNGEKQINFEQIASIKEGEVWLLEEKSEFVRYFQPSAGVMFTPTLPLGQVGGVLSMGFGFSAFGELYMHPAKVKFLAFIQKMNMEAYAGLSAGFTPFSSNTADYTATVNLIPILLYAKFAFPVKAGSIRLMPYLRLGGGMTMTSLNKTFNTSVTGGQTGGNASYSLSSVDGTFL